MVTLIWIYAWKRTVSNLATIWPVSFPAILHPTRFIISRISLGVTSSIVMERDLIPLKKYHICTFVSFHICWCIFFVKHVFIWNWMNMLWKNFNQVWKLKYDVRKHFLKCASFLGFSVSVLEREIFAIWRCSDINLEKNYHL